MTDDDGIRFGISTGVVVVATLVAGLSRLGTIDAAVLVLAVAGLAAASLRASLAPVLGIVAWAFYTGFLENSFGQLTLAGPDLGRLAGFAAITAALALGVRHSFEGGGARHE